MEWILRRCDLAQVGLLSRVENSLMRVEWRMLSRTGAERTSVREHRKRRKRRQATAGVEFATGSNMQSHPQRLHGRLLERLALRRMRMDCAGDVFQAGAHFDGQAERGRQFRDALPDGLDA